MHHEKAKRDRALFEQLCRWVFVIGFSEKAVSSRWAGMREALAEFDFERLATWGAEEMSVLAADTRVVRNRRKLASVVSNARMFVAIAEEHGSVEAWLTRLPSDEVTRQTAMISVFDHVGPAVARAFLGSLQPREGAL